MAARSDYMVGTVTLTSGSKNFTTTGASLESAFIQAGDAILTSGGLMLIIDTITGQNSGTLRHNSPVTANNVQLVIRFQPDGSRLPGAVRDLLARWGQNGTLDAIAGLTTAKDTLAFFTGAGTADVTALTAWARTLLAVADGAAGYAALGAVPDANISNTLPAEKAFRRGNILGNVSQSGGVPTGAIIQQGSNANGEFVRFADGTQICVGRGSFTVDSPNTTSARLSYVWAFPASFVATENQFSSLSLPLGQAGNWVNISGGNTGRASVRASGSSGASFTTQTTFDIFFEVGSVDTLNSRVDNARFLVIGRWI
jgi:hypothetical protein